MTGPLHDQHWLPDWARRAVIYHLYPQGFLDAPYENTGGDSVPRLAGLRRWYDHFKELGVTAIQFGPLFESSSHGYDTTDYYRIDRRLGDLNLFREIVSDLHEMGVRVLLDGVFNHSGREFFAFRDVREKGRESSYSGWYHIQWDGNSHFNDGFVYAGWNGHQSLPNFNHQHPEVKKYLFEVARFWLADVGVDGWRLDAADAVDPSFWWEFRQACKEARPGSFLLGELVHGDYNAYVASDLLDSATNYQLYKPIWSALNDANFWELKHALDRAFHAEIGIYNQLTLVNFLSNHDVTRILSQLNDSRHIYPVLIFLMTAPGIPAIYYGDEVGLKGRKEDGDAALRSPMPLPDSDWPDQERHLFRETRRLIALRKAYPALTYGRYAALDTTGTQFSYLRDYEGQVVIVALNAENDPVPMTLHVGREGVRDGVTFYDVLNPEQGGYTATGGLLNLPEVWGNWGRVLVASR